MKKIKCFLLSIAIAGFTAVAPAQKQPQNPQAYGMGDRFFPMLGRVLTEEQRKSLGHVMEAQRDQILPLAEKIRASREALLKEIIGGKFDEKATRQYAGQSAKAEAELTVIFAKALSQMQPPLSARQIEQLKNFSRDRFQRANDESADAPPLHMKLPPPLPHDTNDLPVMPQK
jgi:Spy/CpxP family protein refolding chaperone